MMCTAQPRIIGYNRIMRTTLSIDDDVLEAARCLAEARHIPLGQAVSTLARRGIRPLGLRVAEDGMLVFDTPADFPQINDADVARILADFP
jgi:hypothetical protein